VLASSIRVQGVLNGRAGAGRGKGPPAFDEHVVAVPVPFVGKKIEQGAIGAHRTLIPQEG
jgi:hypothetical protein